MSNEELISRINAVNPLTDQREVADINKQLGFLNLNDSTQHDIYLLAKGKGLI